MWSARPDAVRTSEMAGPMSRIEDLVVDVRLVDLSSYMCPVVVLILGLWNKKGRRARCPVAWFLDLDLVDLVVTSGSPSAAEGRGVVARGAKTGVVDRGGRVGAVDRGVETGAEGSPVDPGGRERGGE